jgi:hypothetical protein
MATTPFTDGDRQVLNGIAKQPHIVAVNKKRPSYFFSDSSQR